MDVGRFWLNMRRDGPVVEKLEQVAAPVEPEAPPVPLVEDGLEEVWVPAAEVETQVEPADGFLRENGVIVGDIYSGRYKKASAVRGKFIETEDGFLRLDVVQRFEVTEAYPDRWRVDAYVDQYLSVKVGIFASEAEARETVIRMIEV